MAKILNFPIAGFIKSVFQETKRKQNELQQKKINFLYIQAFQCFYDQLETHDANGELDLTPIHYETERIETAKTMARTIVLDVVKDNRVNHCYSKRIKELKKEDIKSLKALEGLCK